MLKRETSLSNFAANVARLSCSSYRTLILELPHHWWLLKQIGRIQMKMRKSNRWGNNFLGLGVL